MRIIQSVLTILMLMMLLGCSKQNIKIKTNAELKQDEIVKEKEQERQQKALNAAYQLRQDKIESLGYERYGAGLINVMYDLQDGQDFGWMKRRLYDVQTDWIVWSAYSDIVIYKLDDSYEFFLLAVTREKGKIYSTGSYMGNGLYAIIGIESITYSGRSTDIVVFTKLVEGY